MLLEAWRAHEDRMRSEKEEDVVDVVGDDDDDNDDNDDNEKIKIKISPDQEKKKKKKDVQDMQDMQDMQQSYIARVESLMPQKVKKRRALTLSDGTSAGMEEYWDYVFPEEQGEAPALKLLAAAQRWKKKRKVEEA